MRTAAQKSCSTKCFGTVTQKTIRRKNVNPLFYPCHFSIPESDEILKDSTTKFFGTVRQNFFDRKWWYCPPSVLSINFFLPGNFLKHSTEGFPLKNFGNERQKSFDGKSWYSPSFLSINILASGKFFETQHRRVALRNVSVLWDKKNWRKNVNPPFLSLTTFDTRNWWNTRGFPYEVVRHCETNKIRQKMVIFPPVLSINFFVTRKKWNTKMFPYEIFRHCETKNIRRKTLILLAPYP